MREIKFREWHQNHMRYWDDIGFFHLYVLNDGKGVFEQYTGLKEKNGVEIYEGDILQHKASKFINFTVVFKYGCYYAHDTSEIMSDSLLGSLNFDNEMTVIGNIHKHPELLEGDE